MQHLVGNTIGYIPSAILVITACPGRFRWIFWGIALIAGAGIWLIGTPGSVHVGASGLVFGLIGFALSCAIWMPTFFYGAITGLTIALFIGILPGMLPIVERGVSWEGHAMGFLGGVIMSFIFLKSLAGRKPTPPTFRFIANKKI
jgi:membrane associated rhomboid family serine protease